MSHKPIAAGLLVVAFAAAPAEAACCRLIKIDSEPPTLQVRVCPAGICESPLFEGTLSSGQQTTVCTNGDTLTYEEWDPDENAYHRPVYAQCTGGDVEL